MLIAPGPEEPSPEVFKGLKRLVYADHKVKKGEYSSWHLAKAYGTNSMSLQTTNGHEMLILHPGMKVVVHNKDGMLYEVKRDGETLDEIVARHHKERKAALRFKESVITANRLPASALLDDHEFSKGTRLLLPKVTMVFDTYRFPFMGSGWPRISSRFGRRYHPVLKRYKVHEGLDLPQPWGTPVVPARSGQVVEAGWREGYGMLVVIRHADGATTRYGHLSKIQVKAGQLVQRGKTVIGRVGSTGLSTGPHLHFELRDKAGRTLNPVSKIGRR